MKKLIREKKYAVRVDRLTFGYRKTDACFSSADFCLEENEKAILISGSHLGKSSLIRLLAGLETEYIGKMEILGETGSGLKRAYRNVVYLPEKPVFLENKSVAKNFEFAYETLMKDSIDMDYVVKTPRAFLGCERLKVSKLGFIDRMKLEICRARLKDISLLLIDRSVEDLKRECRKFGCNFELVKSSLKMMYRKIISDSKNVILACENAEDISFYGAENFKILYLYNGKIYKFENIEEFEKAIVEIDVLKYFKNRKNTLVKLAFEDGKYYIYESRAKSKNQFLLMLDENIKKRKLLDKNMKKHIKNGDYEQKCAEIKNLFLRKIDLDDYPKVMNAITKSNLEMEDYFVVSTKKDPMVSKLKIFDREFVMFACSTGEKVL